MRRAAIRGVVVLAVAATLPLAGGRVTSAAANAPLPLPCAPLLQPPLCTPAQAPPLLSSPTSAPGPSPGRATPHATPTPTPTPKPTPGGAMAVVGVIDDPALSAKVADVLQHPVTSERPSLLHFKGVPPVSRTAPRPAAQHGAGAWAVAGWVVLMLLVLAMGPLMFLVRRNSRRSLARAARSARHTIGLAADSAKHGLGHAAVSARHTLGHAGGSARHGIDRALPALGRAEGTLLAVVRSRLSRNGPGGNRSRQIAVVGMVLPAVILLVGLVVPAATRSAVPAAAPGGGAAADAIRTGRQEAASLPARVASATPPVAEGWARLLRIEQDLEAQRQQLANREAQVSALTAQLQREPAGSVRIPPLTAQLQQVLTAHQALSDRYNQLLQSEYDFFRGAAADPPVRRQLVATAVASGQPDAPPAVQYNLDIVAAQQQQEAALSAAEAAAPVTENVTALLRSVGRPTLISPMGGDIAQGFGPTSYSMEPPVSAGGHFYPHFHTGIDIDAPEGTPVHAAAGGRVILATSSVDDSGQLVGYGRYVAISHGNGFTTVYGHLESISVHPGQIVQQGDVIGHEGSTGNSTGPHLHFETRVNGSAVDPAPYLRGILHLR